MPVLAARRNRLTLLLLFAAALILFWAAGGAERLNFASIKEDREALETLVDQHPTGSALIFALVYIGAVALSLPGAAILTIAAGALFGFATGAILASLSSTIGATLAMLAARFIARDWVGRRFPGAVATVDRGIARYGNAFLLSLRLAPMFPFFMINLAMGLTAMPPLRFAILTIVGALPGTFAYTYVGTALADVDSISDIVTPELLGAFFVPALLPLIGKWLARQISRSKLRGKIARPRRYDANLIVIGAGSAGLVASLVARQLNARVVLIERGAMGGDCLNTGCVPSKSLIRAAAVGQELRRAARFGVQAGPIAIDFAAVMRRVGETIAAIAPNDSVERFVAMGVDVRTSHARLVDPWTVELDDRQRLTGRSIIIATGAEPVIPDIPGLHDSGFVTSETLWEALSKRVSAPKRVVVIGGGPIGCELGQSLARLGSEVRIVTDGDRILKKEDAGASDIVAKALQRNGVEVLAGRTATRFANGALHLSDGSRLRFDMLLLAVGRAPRLKGLCLEELGFDLDAPLTRQRREPWSHIHFVGDAAGEAQFTHFAGHSGALAAINAVAGALGRRRTDTIIPRVTFTDPEVASVGVTEEEARAAGRDVEVVRYELAALDRAVIDDHCDGFVKLVTKSGTDRLLGATIVGRHAGELIVPWVLALKRGIGLKAIFSTIHPYPTYSEAGRAAAGEWQKSHKPDWLLALLGRWLAWRRG